MSWDPGRQAYPAKWSARIEAGLCRNHQQTESAYSSHPETHCHLSCQYTASHLHSYTAPTSKRCPAHRHQRNNSDAVPEQDGVEVIRERMKTRICRYCLLPMNSQQGELYKEPVQKKATPPFRLCEIIFPSPGAVTFCIRPRK